MTIFEAEKLFPDGSGFHDTYITQMNLDYLKRTVEMVLLFDERHGEALLVLHDVQSLRFDEDPFMPKRYDDLWIIDVFYESEHNKSPSEYKFFINNLNGYLHVKSETAELTIKAWPPAKKTTPIRAYGRGGVETYTSIEEAELNLDMTAVENNKYLVRDADNRILVAAVIEEGDGDKKERIKKIRITDPAYEWNVLQHSHK